MPDSVFTRIIRREIPAVIVHEDAQVIAFMDAGQVNPGHVLVATKRQVETVMELDETEAAHLFAIATRVAKAVQAAFEPEGMTLLQTRVFSAPFFKMRCGSKKPCGRHVDAAGVTPGKSAQHPAWLFWPQPEGNGVQAAPLVVALLAQATCLGVVARLDWRRPHPVRT